MDTIIRFRVDPKRRDDAWSYFRSEYSASLEKLSLGRLTVHPGANSHEFFIEIKGADESELSRQISAWSQFGSAEAVEAIQLTSPPGRSFQQVVASKYA